MTQVRRSVGRHLQRVFTVSAIRNPQIAEEKKSLMDGKKSAAVRAMAVLREAAGATSLNRVSPDRGSMPAGGITDSDTAARTALPV
jgi:hypothetical protein